jgi:hypothetical protein
MAWYCPPDICSKGSELDRGNSTSDSLERLSNRRTAGSTPDKGADATFNLKTALQTLREHDHKTGYVDLVKAYDTESTEKCYGRSSQLGVPESLTKCSSCIRMLRSTQSGGET